MESNKLITNYFRLHNVRQFIESISEPANTIYYVFGGKPSQYTLGDNSIDPPVASIENLYTNVYDEMVFAKQILSSDVKSMCDKYMWTTQTVYDMYDSQDPDLENKNFFVVSAEAGSYYIFKCLYNNDGGISTSQPLFSATSADDPYYETADGYVWKYLYKIDSSTYNKFSTDLYVPIVEDANVTSNAVSGSIDIIKIESGGINYNNYLSGSFTAADIRYGGNPLKHRLSSGDASSIEDFYKGCIIKIISGVGSGQYRTITGYYIIDGYKFIFIDSPFTTNPINSVFQINPRVIVKGDGRESVNVIAQALINAYASNTVYKIDILDKGKDYFYATANVYASSVVRTSNSVNDASLRPIIPPRGGHGYDVEAELYASHIGISVKFSNNENGAISTDNDFRTIGLLKDPKFKDVQLNIGSLTGVGFLDTETVVQLDTIPLSGSVRISENTKNVYALASFSSLSLNDVGNVTFANSDIISISNVSVNAICNLTTNSTGYIQSFNLVSSGFGFSDPVSPIISIANSTGGNVRYVNDSIIVNYSIANGGLAYSNADIIYISGPTSLANASAKITTNSTGGISSLVITSSGRRLYANALTIKIANSTGGYANGSKVANVEINRVGDDNLYSNTDYIVFPSPSSINGNAVANIVTSSTGNISSITINAGNNYGFNIGLSSNLYPFAANSTGGYIRYFDTFLAKNISITNSSPSYKIANLAITTAGQNYDSTKILRVDVLNGGIGYNSVANNIIVFSGGSGSGANATFVNNNIGVITAITMVANGTGYLSSPTAIPSATANGIGANLSVVLANTINISSTSGYGAIVYFANNGSGNVTSISIANAGFNYLTVPAASIADPTGTGATFSVNLTGGANSFQTDDIVTISSTIYNSVNAVANITANATYYISSINVTNAGREVINGNVFVSNSSGGNIRFFNGSAIKEIIVNSGGYTGLCSNADILKVTNGIINAIGNIVTNTVGGLSTINMTNSGKGFANHSSLVVYIANSSGSNIRYLNSNIVSSYAINDGGTGYNDSDYVVISSSAGGINATANILTDATGSIVSLSFNNRGRNIPHWFVSGIDIVNGGSGYSNADQIIFTGGNGTGANALLLTNATGGIVRAFIVDGGINYHCAPSVNIANSSGGSANGSSANLVASITKSSKIRIYRSDGNSSNGTFADIGFTVSASPNVNANLIYSPTVSVSYANAASFDTNIVPSCNLSFISNSSANISINLYGQTTSFENSLVEGQYVYLVSNQNDLDLIKVNNIVNSSLFIAEDYPAFTSNSVFASAATVKSIGNVLDQSTSILHVTNVSGFFKTSNIIYGLSSKTSANVNSIQFNGISKTGSVVNQLFSYDIISSTGTFQEDEIISTEFATARYHSSNATVLNVTSQKGIFYPGNTVIAANGNIVLDSGPSYKYEGDFVRGSGDIIYIENISPISRSNSQSETIKLIMEF